MAARRFSFAEQGATMRIHGVDMSRILLVGLTAVLAAGAQQYTRGIAAVDKLAGGDFTKATPDNQDKILAMPSVSAFTALLFEHTIEGLYAAPEYGGNRGLAGWKNIGFPGDIQPRGYTSDEVERSDGHDPVDDTGVVADVLRLLGAV